MAGMNFQTRSGAGAQKVRQNMKVFMSCDIEGTTGIATWDETEKTSPSYAYFAGQMTKEAAAACRGAEEAGAEKILVKDAHDTARNIIPSELPEIAWIHRGWSGDMLSMMSGIQTEKFDAALMTGYHSCASSDGNPLSHTICGNYDYVKINGALASEFLINAYIAGYYKVPVCFLSGDQALCKSAEELIPSVTTVATTIGMGGAAISMHPAVAVRKIENGVKKALTGDFRSCQVPMPEHFHIETCFKEPIRAFSGSNYPGAVLEGTKIVHYESDDYMEILRFINFAM